MRKPHPDREALFPAKTEPPLDSSDEVKAEPTPERTEIPVYPCAIQLTKISEEWAIMRATDIKVSAMFSLERSQLIELGAAFLKCGNSMPSPKQLEKAERKLILP